MFENLMENQKKMFEMWQNFFQKSSEPSTNINPFFLPQDVANPFLKMSKSSEIYKDFFNFYENFQKSFMLPENNYNFANFQKLFSSFQDNYSNIILKIMGLDEITPAKILENFTKQYSGLELFGPIQDALKLNDFNKLFENFYSNNLGTFETFLKMPSFWLTREINDLIKEVINNLLEYTKKVEEFREVISKQTNKGFEIFLEEIKKQPQLNDFDEFFKKWINSNEKIFHDFFKSKEYGELLGNLLKAGTNLKTSIDKYTYQILKESNIATKFELDRAYKEIYTLKKELKNMKNKINELESKISKKREENK